MKLLVIVLSLLSERYLVHSLSHRRFSWYAHYSERMASFLPRQGLWINAYFHLAIVILPILLASWIVLAFSCHLLFGFITFLLNLLIFYYCLGPDNAFYPITTSDSEKENAEQYFYRVNTQVFAIIFWYTLLGPLAIIFYRLLSLACKNETTQKTATTLINIIDWPSARITLFLYLLVGNFQKAFGFYTRLFFASPSQNALFLGQGGVLAVSTGDEEVSSLARSQTLVEHALILFLVLIAFFTLVAWL